MTIEGSGIFQTVQFMDLLNRDISRLITAVDEGMQGADLKSLWGSPIYSKTSKQLAQAVMWLPHTFARVYVPETKDNQTFSKFAFLSIYLTPKHHQTPLAHWGVGRRKEGADIVPAWDQRILGTGGPHFLRKGDINPFEASEDLAGVLHEFRHAAKPLTHLDSAEALERLVLTPVIQALESMADPQAEAAEK